ncbi:hypothetical protein Plav_2170 [Parvibaculum lavamentivorans DS-1]|uniref:Lipoprotein n=1 Tax=Parvibaculum lavamentivorans (strain DS-1 / DSM 13023 / NCIMB 13966) TaxID=402881 RepID=A7HV51_PARL1|nr:hypothetical protein Plav_2170 [Parvibaculum lavamentivorans DS-1]
MQETKAIGVVSFSRGALLAVAASMLLAACNPTVKIEAPDKPIEINLNVKIEQEVRVKVDRDLDDLLESNPDLF